MEGYKVKEEIFEQELDDLRSIKIGLDSVCEHMTFKDDYKFIQQTSKKLNNTIEEIEKKLLSNLV